MPSHHRNKNIAYDDNDVYSDEEIYDEEEEGEALSLEDKGTVFLSASASKPVRLHFIH